MRTRVDFKLPESIPDEGTSVDPPTPPPPTIDLAKKLLPAVSDPGHLPMFVKDEELSTTPAVGDAAVKDATSQIKDMTLNEPIDPDQYPMNHATRGLFVLFNMMNFGDSRLKRKGTDEDADQMVRTFQHGFQSDPS